MSIKTPSIAGAAASAYINDEAISREATAQEIHDLGGIVDNALKGLATDTAKYCRDEVTLAHLTMIESVFYNRIEQEMPHTHLAVPALDYIIPCYPDNRAVNQIGIDILHVAGPWLKTSNDYHPLIGGIINYLQGRMRCAVTNAGRFVFYPVSSLDMELRNRWFDLHRFSLLQASGQELLKVNSQTTALVERLDKDIASQDASICQGIYIPPSATWYTQFVDDIADSVLRVQFAYVGDKEVWGGLSKEQIIKAVRPIYVRAARRLFAHLRVQKYLRDRYQATGPALPSTVEVIDLAQLIIEISTSAGISTSVAESFARSMLRTGREGRFPLNCYPLIPLFADRAAYLPSAVLFANWPAARERMAGRSMSGQNSVNRAREQRHTAMLVDAIKAAGIQYVDQAIKIFDSATGQPMTDLDIVLVDDACANVLVMQLKSFLTPVSLLDLDKADTHVQEAYGQCAQAEANPEAVRTAIRSKLGITLINGWSLKHIVVVEAVTGTLPPHAKYPAVSLEWVRTQVSALTSAEINKLWQAAVDLPDGRQFFESIAPAFELFDDHVRDLKTGRSAAVFTYDAD